MNHQESIRRSLVGASRAVCRGAVLGSLMLLAGCGAGDAGNGTQAPEPSSTTQAELPELERVGGVQDVWALPFGMNADRDTVRAELGEPAEVERPERPEDAGGPMVERWRYEGLVLTFLVDPVGEQEYLLTARILDESVPIRGGLRIGMSVEEAIALLGEPRVVDEESRVYFYRDTTIEIIERGDEVVAIQLARALP